MNCLSYRAFCTALPAFALVLGIASSGRAQSYSGEAVDNGQVPSQFAADWPEYDAGDSCSDHCRRDSRPFWAIDAATWNGDLVFTNSGVNKHLFNTGAGMELALSHALRLPPAVWLEWNEDAELVGTVGFGGQAVSGNESVQLVQGPAAVFRLADAELYWLTFGAGVQGYRDICDGFTVTSWLGCEALVGRTNGNIIATVADPALEPIAIIDPVENAFLWGGEIEARVGFIGPRGWALYAGASYDAYRTRAFTGEDHGSTAISGTLAVERRFGL